MWVLDGKGVEMGGDGPERVTLGIGGRPGHRPLKYFNQDGPVPEQQLGKWWLVRVERMEKRFRSGIPHGDRSCRRRGVVGRSEPGIPPLVERQLGLPARVENSNLPLYRLCLIPRIASAMNGKMTSMAV